MLGCLARRAGAHHAPRGSPRRRRSHVVDAARDAKRTTGSRGAGADVALQRVRPELRRRQETALRGHAEAETACCVLMASRCCRLRLRTPRAPSSPRRRTRRPIPLHRCEPRLPRDSRQQSRGCGISSAAMRVRKLWLKGSYVRRAARVCERTLSGGLCAERTEVETAGKLERNGVVKDEKARQRDGERAETRTTVVAGGWERRRAGRDRRARVLKRSAAADVVLKLDDEALRLSLCAV